MDHSNYSLTHYQVLGVSRDATLSEIKTAYRKKVMKLHPDVNPMEDSSTCHEMMCMINEAYSILRDIDARIKYDAELEEHGIVSPECGDNCSHNIRTQSTRAYSPVSDSDRYKYYQTCDYDSDTESEFIKWMNEAFNSYLNYYFGLEDTDYNLINEVQGYFNNIFDYEMMRLKKTIGVKRRNNK